MPRPTAQNPRTSDAIGEAITNAGGVAPLAQALGITYQSVYEWLQRGTVPPSRVLELERMTGVSRHRLRPDIYGARPPRKQVA